MRLGLIRGKPSLVFEAPLTFPTYVAEDAMQALNLWSAGCAPCQVFHVSYYLRTLLTATPPWQPSAYFSAFQRVSARRCSAGYWSGGRRGAWAAPGRRTR